MRYLDTGTRDPADTLASWLTEATAEPVQHLRLQTGFFVLDGLYPLLGVLDDLKAQDLSISALVGSNSGGTLRSDVEELAFRMGVPRAHARLGVVRFGGSAYFHPKVYHFERADGTQAAFVGSANLTGSGLALHTEAGIALDSRDDDPAVLTKIASAIDQWFLSQQAGVTVVDQNAVLDQLVAQGVLALVPLPRQSSKFSGGKSGNTGVNQPVAPMLKIPQVPRLVTSPPPPPAVLPAPSTGIAPASTSPASTTPASTAPASTAPASTAPASTAPASTTPASTASASTTPASTAPTSTTPAGTAPASTAPAIPAAFSPSVVVPAQAALIRPVTTRTGFPQYLLFEPNATTSTSGSNALTGSILPNGIAGLIVKLNRDSARHFAGAVGTSNISLPVATAFTLRFGVAGIHNGPTAQFDLQMRYVGDSFALRANDTTTSVKGYGYTASETGHGDIRMVVTAEARRLKDQIIASARTVPSIDEFAILEWPTDPDPSFKLSFLDPQSALYQQTAALYTTASAANQLVGTGACWLPAGTSPIW